jgi:hypothetical protein|tara:strand:- start:82 stop:1467 length:1386 start_codon:yes stop_codon:yes gene_type:complete
MPFILGTNSIKDTGYDVANSCRFDDGSSDNLTRTQTNDSSNTKFNFSVWIKRCNLGASQVLYATQSGSDEARVEFNSSDQLFWYKYNGSSFQWSLQTNRVFRDVSAWYHINLKYDSTQGTSSNRLKMYINGVEETSFSQSGYPSSSENSNFFQGATAYLGCSENTAGFFDGYMSEYVILQGQALEPTSFGEFDEDSPNIWKPKDVSGLTFGTNGFYLDFEDSSALGNDVSGNNNDFTVNNLTATDQSTDTCTNNFATMNPLAITYSANTFSEGNLKITTISGASSYNQATIGVSSGKWFWEVKYVSDTDGGADYARIGIADIDPPGTGGLGEVEGIAYEAINGRKKLRGSQSTYGDTYAPGDIIGVALNLDDNELTFYKNGVAQNSGTAIDISSYTPKTGFWHPAFNYDDGSHSGVFEANFGSPSFSISSGNADGNGYGNFEYAVPSGFFSLCTKNLAEHG